jgi:hypothetical protein
MKASEIIRGALSSHYVNKEKYNGGNQSEYMCFAIKGFMLDVLGYQFHTDEYHTAHDAVCDTFMPELHNWGTGCLMVMLNRSNKRYASLCRRAKLGHDTPGCFKIRVQYWLDHIAELESKGL